MGRYVIVLYCLRYCNSLLQDLAALLLVEESGSTRLDLQRLD